ncbi:MAG: 2TM domain-containing protein [Maribacter sp.]
MENLNDSKYRKAKERIKEIKSFYSHAFVYIIVMSLLALLNYNTTNFPWVVFPAIGWGIGLLSHGLGTFGHNLILGKNWEERKIKELMEKNEF